MFVVARRNLTPAHRMALLPSVAEAPDCRPDPYCEDASTEDGAEEDASTEEEPCTPVSAFEAAFELVGSQPIARGCFASVWRCRRRDQSDGAEFAVKCIETTLLLERDRRHLFGYRGAEGELALHTDCARHPHVVELREVFDGGSSQSPTFPAKVSLVMELCGGGSLAGLLDALAINKDGEQSGLSVQGSAQALKHLLSAIQHLHEKRVVHRDVKCDNVVIAEPVVIVPAERATFKLCDFGLAVRLQEEGSSLFGRVGTPHCVAPEVLNREAYGRPCDLWAAGCVLRACGTFVGAETLLRGLLEPRQYVRLTAATALAHPWLRHGGATDEAVDGGDTGDGGSEVRRDWIGAFCCRRRSNVV